ncbi:DUF3015 family protein [Rheinheimera sp.]|uniref:DUF3015 family protein n=1 Tax=Rheinheimera sp. TaxID=1869214 RepID=UPI00307E323C
MKKTMMFSALVLSLLSATSVMAEDKPVGSGPNPYADCGIGAALFTETKALAVTSNVIWDLGTTAVTSATASPETCNGKKVAVATFILQSYDPLMEDTARGQGKHLDTLLGMMEVSAQDKAAVITSLRQSMAANLASAQYLSAGKIEKSAQYFNSAIAAHNAV